MILGAIVQAPAVGSRPQVGFEDGRVTAAVLHLLGISAQLLRAKAHLYKEAPK